jgi:hypothetical protein
MTEIFELDPIDEPIKAAKKSSDKNPTVLDQLKTVLSKKVERDVVYIEVPERPGVLLKVSPNITQHQMRSWRKNAGEESKNGLDALRFACSVVGHTTLGFEINGHEVTNSDGVALTFASPEILDMTSTSRPLPDCVRAFFGIDPHVESAAVAIMEAAGYGDTVEAVNPTTPSSTN